MEASPSGTPNACAEPRLDRHESVEQALINAHILDTNQMFCVNKVEFCMHIVKPREVAVL